MDDTIIATSTLVGNSAINIVRLSGKDSIKVVSKFFHGKDLIKVKPNTINYGKIIYKGEVIDEVLVSIFHKDKSFTKEEMVEINSHGGIMSVNKILSILLEENIRMAEPGEFIKRAFLNGRIDLVEAEAVSDLINADTENARKLSVNGINGKISDLIKDVRKDLVQILGNVEVNIDYPEYEDITKMTNKLLKQKIKDIEIKLTKIYVESEKSNIIKNGINVAIVGKPNVGKSSILNHIIKEEKAIVTDVKGTTRDIVEGTILLDGTKINFIDTAGIRETKDKVESIGVKKSLEAAKKSDLVLLILSNNEPLSKEDKNIMDQIDSKKKLIVINKSDLDNKLDTKFEDEVVYVNTVEKDGLVLLEEKIKQLFNLGKINTSDFNYLTNERQLNILKQSINIIKDIKDAISKNLPIDMIEIDIKRLWEKLGEIIGETYKDELLDEIFSKFCLGK